MFSWKRYLSQSLIKLPRGWQFAKLEFFTTGIWHYISSTLEIMGYRETTGQSGRRYIGARKELLLALFEDRCCESGRGRDERRKCYPRPPPFGSIRVNPTIYDDGKEYGHIARPGMESSKSKRALGLFYQGVHSKICC
ncbi:hypothetical protein BS47DRAFT_1128013 [Hydnum rufescens UP504]|uniref:Uncharacterized protein n=1 Tax=Hydnum rufescens UP504 TaxID=1448309 RepID=A0A9P6AU41_9AGAM|nr:hypothetical protein BS47DRAFT_1128013 [Hydnum rufescens UP504]